MIGEDILIGFTMAFGLKKFAIAGIFSSFMIFSLNARAEMLSEGMLVGVGGNYAFKMTLSEDENKDVMKRDYGLGGYLSLGYLMGSGVEGGLELGYRSIKFLDKLESSISFKVNSLIALLVGSYYIDMGSAIHPYVKAGVGINRIGLEAAADLQKASSDKQNAMAYKAGVGIATVFDSIVLGVGYEFFGTLSTNWAVIGDPNYRSNSNLRLKAVKGSGIDVLKLEPKTHSIEAFVKMVF